MGKKFLIVAMLLFFFVSIYAQQIDTDPFSGYQPQIDVKQTITPLPKDALGSAIQPLTIYNPYAAAGQPVVVEFTLTNIGKEYPYNQIPVPPDSYALVMSVDKDLGVVVCKEKTP